MEASVANLFSPGDKVLVINGGKFGERWLNISNAYGLHPVELKVEWGQAVKVADVETQLKTNTDIQGVMIQASETSTTVLHPVKEIAKLTRNGPLFLVDGVTAVGVVSLPLDEWGIDALVTGSQKALMLPPGLAFVAVSAIVPAAAGIAVLRRMRRTGPVAGMGDRVLLLVAAESARTTSRSARGQQTGLCRNVPGSK